MTFREENIGTGGADISPQRGKYEFGTGVVIPKYNFSQEKEADEIANSYPDGNVDGFIDDMVSVVINEKDNWFKLSSCVPLSIYTMVYPVNKN